DADHVGREGLELFGGGLLELRRVELGRGVFGQLRGGDLAVLADDLDAEVFLDDIDVGVRLGRDQAVRGLLLVVFVLQLVGVTLGRSRRAQAGQLGLDQVRLGPAGSRQDGFDELLVKRIDGHGLCSLSNYALGTGIGSCLFRRVVWSRRRWSDSRWALIAW